MKDLSRVVNESARCNFAQFITAEDGTTVVPIIDWADFFALHTKKLIGIKKYHHVRFSSAEPGVVYKKLQCDTAEQRRVAQGCLAAASFMSSICYCTKGFIDRAAVVPL